MPTYEYLTSATPFQNNTRAMVDRPMLDGIAGPVVQLLSKYVRDDKFSEQGFSWWNSRKLWT